MLRPLRLRSLRHPASAAARECGHLGDADDGLATGIYCDRITGGRVGASCAGTSVVVGAGGTLALSLAALSAVAIDVETKL